MSTTVRPFEFPHGGRTLMPDCRMVALYGSVEHSALGVLGEQSPEEAAWSIKMLAAHYRTSSAEPVYPAFEIITTMAVAAPGADGSYSRPIPLDGLRPWIDVARREGVYVVLDLQPGREDFVAQARRYEAVLAEPHVGLALDPEWRLAPGQLPREQIGTVQAEEINRTADWLADLTASHRLPQKLLLIHQFRVSMIGQREDLDTSRPELAWVVQMDGFGTPRDKRASWAAIRTGAPSGVHFGWKHFIDEDTPLLTPEQTMRDVDPPPWYLSYQ